MDEKRIREKYQRDDPEDQRGLNKGGMDNFINMLKVHEGSTDKNIRSIVQNFDAIETLAPNFTIFEARDNKCGFMHQFKALLIGKETDILVSSHEFGHGILSMTTDVQVPENFCEILEGAKAHALSPNNKDTFKAYIEFLCKFGKDVITPGERGPVSDIISSVFQQIGFRINTPDNECYLPCYHKEEYYKTKDGKGPNLKAIYDEDFANFYALKATNCKKEIETLKTLFGEEFVQTLENQLELSAGIMEKTVEQTRPKLTPAESIMPVVQGVRAQEILEVAQEGKNMENEPEVQNNDIVQE